MARVETAGFVADFRPNWAVDYFGRVNNLPGGARLDPSAFPNIGLNIAKANGAAAAGATSITVDALPARLPANTLLDFTGTGEFARVTADAAEGATSISVEALDAGVEDNDEAYYGSVRKSVKSGTVVGRTNAERDANTGFGPAADADDEVYILIFTVYDANINPDCELLRSGSGVKFNHLPNWTTLSSAIQTKLAAKYELTRGAA